MYRRKSGIMGRISALTLGAILAANSFTAFAAGVGGDVNADGKTDVTDIAVTAAHIKGIKALDSEAAVRADVDGDGKINVTDIAMLAAHIKGIKALPGTNREPVYELKNLSGASLIGSAKGRLVTRKDLTAGDRTAKSSYEYKVINAKTEKTERTIKSGIFLELVGIKQDGTLIMRGFVKDKGTALYFFAEGSDEPVVQLTGMEYPMIGSDEKDETIYVGEDAVIYKLTADGKLEEIVKATDDRDIFVEMDSANMVAGLSCYTEINPDLSKVSVISLATGKTLWETVQHQGDIAFSQHHAVLSDSIYKDDEMTSALRCFDTETGKKQGVYKMEGSVSRIFTSDGADDIIIGKAEPMDSVTIFNTSTGEAAAVDLGIKEMSVDDAVYIGEDVWAVTVSYAVEDAFEVKTFVIDAAEQEYTKLPEGQDVETLEEFQSKTCGEALKAQREKADKLEEKYGVTILIGDEVLNVEVLGDSWSSVEADMPEDYPQELDGALDELDNWMSVYPEGFFEKFRTDDNPGGYRVLLVEDFDGNENADNEKAGMTFTSSDHIDIALRRDSVDQSTMDHETWHAVELLVGSENPFDEDAWNKFNPEGFEYFNGDYLNGEEPQGEEYEKYLSGYYSRKKNYKNGYFVREYSETDPREDRATIMEIVCPSSVMSGIYRMDEEIEKYPHIKAKLDFMAEWSRQYFGYVYWDEMIKNKYVPAPGEALG